VLRKGKLNKEINVYVRWFSHQRSDKSQLENWRKKSKTIDTLLRKTITQTSDNLMSNNLSNHSPYDCD
jgi:hypothetical protein